MQDSSPSNLCTEVICTGGNKRAGVAESDLQSVAGSEGRSSSLPSFNICLQSGCAMGDANEKNHFLEKLATGETILVAEGYLFELERRCYGKMGSMVPEVLIDNPHKVKELHEEFIHVGTDVVEAYTYYALAEKLKDIGRDPADFEMMNRRALRMARETATAGGCLMAGAVNNTNLLTPGDEASYAKVESIFEQQIRWAVEEGADYIVAESFLEYEEAALALKVIKRFNVPAVVTFMPSDREGKYFFGGLPIPEYMRKMEEEGAAVVGLNCARGPATILPLMKEARKVCKGPLAALPVCYRTTPEEPTMQRLTDGKGRYIYPDEIRAYSCAATDMEEFAKGCKEIGIQYVGLCCGNDPNLFRALGAAYGREPPAKKYMSDHGKKSSFGRTEPGVRDTTELYKFMYR